MSGMGLDRRSLLAAGPLLLAAINYHNPEYLSDAKKLENKPDAETLLLQAQAEAAIASK